MRLLPGVLFGAVLGAAAMGIYSGIGIDVAIATVARQYSVLALLGGATLCALFLLYVFRNAVARLFFGTATREWEDLVQAASDSIDDLAEQRYGELRNRLTEMSKSIVATLTLWAARATLTRVMLGLFIASAGAFGTYVLIQQNQLIASQTTTLEAQSDLAQTQVDLITAQNELLSDQTQIALIASHLQTAARRSVYTPQVTEIVTEINQQFQRFLSLQSDGSPSEFASIEEELRFSYFNTHNMLVLSSELVQRIQRILPLLTPYVVVDIDDFESDSLSDLNNLRLRYVSPERGIILRSLLEHGVNLQDLASEVDFSFGADFSFADMRGFNNSRLESLDNVECLAPGDIHDLSPPYFPRQPENYGNLESDRRHQWRPYLMQLAGLNLTSADFSNAILENVTFEFDLDNADYSQWESIHFSHSRVQIKKISPGTNTLPFVRFTNTTTSFFLHGNTQVLHEPTRLRFFNPCPDSISLDLTREELLASNILQSLVFWTLPEGGPEQGWTALIDDALSLRGDRPLSIERVHGIEERDQFGFLEFTPSDVVFEALNLDRIE